MRAAPRVEINNDFTSLEKIENMQPMSKQNDPRSGISAAPHHRRTSTHLVN